MRKASILEVLALASAALQIALMKSGASPGLVGALIWWSVTYALLCWGIITLDAVRGWRIKPLAKAVFCFAALLLILVTMWRPLARLNSSHAPAPSRPPAVSRPSTDSATLRMDRPTTTTQTAIPLSSPSVKLPPPAQHPASAKPDKTRHASKSNAIPSVNQSGQNNIAQFGNNNQAAINVTRVPLTLSSKQADLLTTALAPVGSGHEVTIWLNHGTDETRKLATDLAAALRRAGVTVKEPDYGPFFEAWFFGKPDGVSVALGPTDQAAAFTQVMCEALISVGLANRPVQATRLKDRVSDLDNSKTMSRRAQRHCHNSVA